MVFPSGDQRERPQMVAGPAAVKGTVIGAWTAVLSFRYHLLN